MVGCGPGLEGTAGSSPGQVRDYLKLDTTGEKEVSRTWASLRASYCSPSEKKNVGSKNEEDHLL